MKICMFVRNPILQDPRVLREAETLTLAGHEVTVIGRSAPGLPRTETWRGVRLIRLPRLGERPRAALAKLRGRSLETTRKSPTGNAESEEGSAGRQARPWHRQALNRLNGELAEANYLANAVAVGVQTGADAFHAHDLDTLEAARLCATLTRGKLVYDSHELFVDWQENKCGAAPWRVARWRAQERRGTARADLVITVSDGLADELAQLYGIRRPLVIRNCPPSEPLQPGTLLRDLIGGDPSRPLVLYQGGFSSGRGLRELVSAADEVPEADFVLLGPPSPFGRTLAEAAATARHHNVFLPGRIPLAELFAYTCSADLGVVLTQPVCRSYELSLGNKAFEYMMAGLPFLASSIEGHRRLAAETESLVLCDPTSARAVAEALQPLVREPAKLREMGRRARGWAERKYNAETEMGQLAAAYAAL